jgi:hypothetical protein
MSFALTITDESTTGKDRRSFTLEVPSEVLTVRELIRERVYQEVQDYNRERTGTFQGLVQPTDAEVALNGFRLRAGLDIDWKAQFEKACSAFEASRIMILAGDHQTESLDERITLTAGSEVTFLRLVPLVGG